MVPERTGTTAALIAEVRRKGARTECEWGISFWGDFCNFAGVMIYYDGKSFSRSCRGVVLLMQKVPLIKHVVFAFAEEGYRGEREEERAGHSPRSVFLRSKNNPRSP